MLSGYEERSRLLDNASRDFRYERQRPASVLRHGIPQHEGGGVGAAHLWRQLPQRNRRRRTWRKVDRLEKVPDEHDDYENDDGVARILRSNPISNYFYQHLFLLCFPDKAEFKMRFILRVILFPSVIKKIE